MGMAHDFAFDVIVCVPEVAEKVIPPLPPPKVMPEESVTSPKKVRA